MSPEAAVALAERILSLAPGVASLIEDVILATERHRPDAAAYSARLAALQQEAAGMAAYSESKHAGRSGKP